MKKIIYRIWGFVLLLCVLKVQSVTAAEVNNEWKNGIVEINAGVTDADGKFHVLKHASGFLVTNSEQNTYIITIRSAVTVSTEEKDNWVKKSGLSEETSNYGMNTSIRVIVKGDVSSEVTIVNQSENEDFAILKSESVIQEKSCLKIGNTDETKRGDIVYSLGFPEKLTENSNAQYTQEEVSVQEGKIDTLSSEEAGVNYITHQSEIDAGEMGGPVLDKTGYVIGLNQKNKDEDSVAYALPITSIKDVLDSYGIEYESKELDQAYEQLQKLYDKGTKMLGERYQKKSLTEIQAELDAAKSVLESDTYKVDAVTSEIDKMETVITHAVPKTNQIYLVMGGLAGVILLLVICLIIISLKERKLSSENKEKGLVEQPVHFQDEVQQPKVRAGEKVSFTQQKKAVLQRLSTGEEIILGEGRLTIGKSSNQADFAVLGNKTISRLHAEIQKTEDGYEILDMGSSNGTFVNGKRISGNGTKLQDKDKVRLSNEEFLFKEM